MARFYLPKTPSGSLNFSVVKDNGDRLSFAADDSAGVFKDRYVRYYLQAFNDNTGKDLSPESYAVSPEEYLKALADFLGYDLVKR